MAGAYQGVFGVYFVSETAQVELKKWTSVSHCLVVWDNLRTVHAATPFDHGLHPREMWRTTVAAPETTAFTTVGLPD